MGTELQVPDLPIFYAIAEGSSGQAIRGAPNPQPTILAEEGASSAAGGLDLFAVANGGAGADRPDQGVAKKRLSRPGRRKTKA